MYLYLSELEKFPSGALILLGLKAGCVCVRVMFPPISGRKNKFLNLILWERSDAAKYSVDLWSNPALVWILSEDESSSDGSVQEVPIRYKCSGVCRRITKGVHFDWAGRVCLCQRPLCTVNWVLYKRCRDCSCHQGSEYRDVVSAIQSSPKTAARIFLQ